jgi:DNA topoisomerase-3
MERMDALFEVQFSPLASTGKPLSKCGKCSRYMKYIPMRPARLYCSSCEEVYNVPQNGAVKLYKELRCPLDNFELVLFSLSGPDGKSYPLCPYCYNNPPFESVGLLYGGVGAGGKGGGAKGGMPCTFCPHPSCPHSMVQKGVCTCPECEGTLVLDPVSAPKWRLDCNRCSCLVYLPKNAHKVSVNASQRCEECESALLEVDFSKNDSPLPGGATKHVGCLLCDELLLGLVEMKHGKAFGRRPGGRGRGRGRGRRGRGRGRGRGEDPKLSFRDF